MEHGNRLKQLREDKDYSQHQIATILGLSQRTYSYYENGRNIPVIILWKLADIYGVSIDYLIGRSNKKSY